MPLCRKAREGNTGIAMNGRAPGSSASRLITYEDSDISAASNSRCLSIRKNVSSTGRLRYVRSTPSGRTSPLASAAVRS